MPYIIKKLREGVEPCPREFAESAAELSYQFNRLINLYVAHKGKRFQTLAEVMGALESTRTEFGRRVVAPYEDAKIKENGDVYT